MSWSQCPSLHGQDTSVQAGVLVTQFGPGPQGQDTSVLVPSLVSWCVVPMPWFLVPVSFRDKTPMSWSCSQVLVSLSLGIRYHCLTAIPGILVPRDTTLLALSHPQCPGVRCLVLVSGPGVLVPSPRTRHWCPSPIVRILVSHSWGWNKTLMCRF